MGFEPMRFWNDFTDRRFRPLSHPLKKTKFRIIKIIKTPKYKMLRTNTKTLINCKSNLDENKKDKGLRNENNSGHARTKIKKIFQKSIVKHSIRQTKSFCTQTSEKILIQK